MAKTRVTNKGKLSKSTRSSIKPSKRDEMPASVFLKPKDKTYPVKKKNAKTGKWEYNANLLLAAQKRAILNGESSIAARAKSIRERIT